MKRLYCQRGGCGREIDRIKVKKGGDKREPQFCSRECYVADRAEKGGYQALSRLGNAAQAAFKAQNGKAPGTRGGKRPPRGPTRKTM